MVGLHFVIQLSKFRALYLVRKRGIFYLQKRIPQQLTGYWRRAFVSKSLRAKDTLEASKLVASQLVCGCAGQVCNTVKRKFKKGNAPVYLVEVSFGRKT